MSIIAIFLGNLLLGCTGGCMEEAALNYDPDANADDESCIFVGSLHEGGILGYILHQGDPGYDPDEPHGLVAFPYDNESNTGWYVEDTPIEMVATGVAIGDGAPNTETIVTTFGASALAATSCADAENEGFDDWFLPSQHEIAFVSANSSLIGGFNAAACYWSSTQTTERHAWVECLDGRIADWGYYSNASPNPVRCLRAI